MANIIDTIENSAVIQSYKEAWNNATTQAEKDAIHKAANDYRLAQGGYKDVYESGQGANFTRVVLNAEKLADDTTDAIKGAAASATDFVKDNTLKIIDTEEEAAKLGYDPADYAIAYSNGSSSGSGTSFDTYLGYGVIGLILVAVLSRIVGK